MSCTVYTSAAWMKLPVDAPQVLAIDVGVDLRGRDVRVPQHVLHRTQVGAALEQMRRERMAERVWRHVRRDPRGGHVFPKDFPGAHPGQRRAAGIQQERPLSTAPL